MTVATTYRTDARAALATLLENFRTANPTLLLQTYPSVPMSVHVPCAWVGRWREPSISLDMSLVTRQPQVELVLAQGEYDNAQTMVRMDVLVDTFVSYLANLSGGRVGANGVLIGLATDEAELTLSGPGGSSATYMTTIVTLTLDIQEGGL